MIFPNSVMIITSESSLACRAATTAAVAVGGLQIDHAFAAARGDPVFGERSALAVALFGDGEHERSERILDHFVFELIEIFRFFLRFLADDLKIRLHGIHADDVIVLA